MSLPRRQLWYRVIQFRKMLPLSLLEEMQSVTLPALYTWEVMQPRYRRLLFLTNSSSRKIHPHSHRWIDVLPSPTRCENSSSNSYSRGRADCFSQYRWNRGNRRSERCFRRICNQCGRHASLTRPLRSRCG